MEPKRPHRLLRWLARWLLRLTVAAAVLVLLCALLLQIPSVRTGVVNAALSQFNPYPGSSLTTRDTDGSVLRSLTLIDAALTDSTGEAMLRVDTLGVRYQLISLLRGRIRVDHIAIYGLDVVARRDSSGGLDVASPFAGQTDTSSTDLSLDHLRIRNGRITVLDASGEWVADRIHVDLDSLETIPTLTFSLDSLSAAIKDPLSGADGVFAAAGSIRGSSARLDTLLYRTSRSLLVAGGRMGFDANRGFAWPADSLEGHLRASPLHFDDIRPLWPDLQAGSVLVLESDFTGYGPQLDGVLRAELGGGLLLLEANGRMAESNAGSAVGAPPVDDPETDIRIRGSAELSRFDPGLLLSTAPESEPITARADVDLSGPDWTLLTGTSALRVDETSVEGVVISGLQTTHVWTESRVRFEGNGGVSGGQIRMGGSASPLDLSRPVDVRIRADALSLEPFVDLNGPALFSGVVRAQGTPDLNTWLLDVTMDGTLFGTCSIEGSTRVEADGIAAQASLNMRLCGGEASGNGRYVFSDASWSIPSIRLSDVAVAQLLADTSRSSVSGSLSASGNEDRLNGRLRLRPSNYGVYRLDSLGLSGTMNGALWTAAGGFRSGPGQGTLRANGSGSQVNLEALNLADMDLAYTASLGDFASAISASVQGTYRPPSSPNDPIGPIGDLAVTVEPSRLNRQSVAGGQATVRLRGEVLESSGFLELLGGGGLDWAGSADLESASTTLDSLSFESIDLEAWMPASLPNSNLTGGASGFLTEDRQAIRLDLDSGGSFRDVPIQGGNALVTLTPDSIRVNGMLLAGQGQVRANGFVDRGSEQFEGYVVMDGVDVTTLAGVDSTAGYVWGGGKVSGLGFDAESSDSLVELDSLRMRWGDILIDSASGNLAWNRGALTLSDLVIGGSPLRGQVAGSIPVLATAPEGRYQLTGTLEIDDLAPLSRLVDLPLGTTAGTATVRGSGSRERYQVSVQSQIDGIRAADLHVAAASAIISVEFQPGLRPSAAEARLDGRVISLPGLAAEQGNLLVTLQEDSLRFETGLRFSPRRQIALTGGSDSDMTRVLLETLDLTLDESAWTLLTPSDILLTDGVEIGGIVMEADSQRIAIGGYTGSTEGDDMYVSAERVRLDAIADLLGYTGLGATLSATVSATSDGPDSERTVSGSVQSRIRKDGKPVGDLDARLALLDRRLNMDARMLHASGSDLVARGFLPLTFTGADMSGQPVSLSLQTQDFPIDWLLPFLDPALVDDLGGKISVDAAVRGTYDQPGLTGSALLADGRIGLPDLGKARKGLVYDDASVALTFQGDRVRVDSAQVHSGAGIASATGTVDLKDLSLGEFNLTLFARDFLAIDSEPYRAIAGANMLLTGTTLQPRLSGSVRVEQGDFQLTEETSAAAFEPVALTREDLLALEERFGIRVTEADTTNFDFYEALTIEDLRVDLERDTWLRSPRNPTMDIQFVGSLEVTKEPNADLEVFGTIEVLPDRSRIDQFGRQFDIQEGALTFNGPIEQPEMRLGAQYTVRSRDSGGDEVTIRLDANGRPEDLTVTFQSDPAMELADIVSYIATGRPASESLQFGGTSSEGYLKSAAGIAVGQITSLVENLAGAGLGLDVVEIKQDESEGLRLTAGKYVSSRFFVSVSQPIALSGSSASSSSSATEVAMEYEVVRSFLLSLLSRGAVLRVNLRWEQSF